MLRKTLVISTIATVIFVLTLDTISGSPAPSSSSSLLGNLDSNRVVSKRYYDSSCQGFLYSKELYKILDQVCDDCTNIYRKLNKEKCRRDCFRNGVFEQCLDRLLLEAEEYIEMRSAIADY
uniref:CHH2 n=1 Tax=Periclimenes brevicarpalis TaxID=390963 RepID=A0A218L0G2_PERBE|nr:CHH2 precursor [Periclimenes brevicarpalis]